MYLNSQSFAPSHHIRESAWLEHSPFIFWLIDILKPRKIVELGTHNGFSFLSQCQAVKSLNINATVFAIDTWQGDEHAGFYNSDVYDNLEAEVRLQYPGIGRLIKSTFAAARSDFEDGSVDLLHIDGRHRYVDVKEDFECWISSLSDGGVVLFHDTCVHRDDFGVYKYWDEISSKYPSFEFFHGNGLGVMIYGREAKEPLKKLCSSEFDEKNFVRKAYSRLGEFNSVQYALNASSENRQILINQIVDKDSELNRLRDNREEINSQLCDKNRELLVVTDRMEELEKEVLFQKNKLNELEVAYKNANISNVRLESEIQALISSRDEIILSKSWQITRPLRAIRSFFNRN